MNEQYPERWQNLLYSTIVTGSSKSVRFVTCSAGPLFSKQYMPIFAAYSTNDRLMCVSNFAFIASQFARIFQIIIKVKPGNSRWSCLKWRNLYNFQPNLMKFDDFVWTWLDAKPVKFGREIPIPLGKICEKKTLVLFLDSSCIVDDNIFWKMTRCSTREPTTLQLCKSSSPDSNGH